MLYQSHLHALIFDTYTATGLDFNDEIADISFMSGQGVGDTSCTSINIIVDSDPEDEESFTIVLQENLLVEVVQPNVSTVFIGEYHYILYMYQ